MSVTPVLSIVIPVHNEESYLVGLIESINCNLNIPYEIIIVDNGSTDRSSDVAERYGCNLIRLPKKVYPAIARNVGAVVTKSDAIAYLDADVLVTKNWANRVTELVSDPMFYRVKKVYGRTYLLSKDPSWLERFWFDPLSQSKKYINGGNILVSKSANDQLNGFDELLETGEDVDYCERAVKSGLALQFESMMEVHHEGYPKDIKSFYKRERWHGRGDWSSLRRVISSKIALICISLLVVYFFSLIIFVWFIICGNNVLIPILISLFYVFAICFLSSYMRFNKFGIKSILMNSLIYFVYFHARIHSIFYKS